MDRLLTNAFEITLVLSGATSLGAVSWMAWRKQTPTVPREPARLFLHPWSQFALVCAFLLVNQVFYNAYVRAAHGGDPSFLTRYLGRGWCAGTPDAWLVKLVAEHVPVAWLSMAVLRAQAFLELPFALLAYLTVAYQLDRGLYRALVRSPLMALASASFTAAFCIVELQLHNPWTESDLAVRVVSAVVTPAWLVWAARGHRGKPHFPARDGRPRTLLGLLAFFVGAAAVATIVLVMYDVTLLYNLAHLSKRLPVLALATLAASAVFAWARRADAWTARTFGADDEASPPASIGAITSALVVFTAVFFVPSLVLRYWGPHASAVCLAAVLLLTGMVGGIVSALGTLKSPAARARWVFGACVASGVGLWSCATDALGLATGVCDGPEEILLQKSLLLALPAIVVWRLVEAITDGARKVWKVWRWRGGVAARVEGDAGADDACASGEK